MSAETLRNLRSGLLFISPWILGFCVFMAYPLVSSLYYSFTEYNILNPPKWIGVENYTNLFQDSRFLKALTNTAIYVGVMVPLSTAVAIALALLLNAKVRFLPLFRTAFYLPVIVPVVVNAILWNWIFQPSGGLLNSFMQFVGLRGPAWLTLPEWVMPSLVLMSLWTLGNTVIIYLASLQDVPKALLEAAEIDGAGPVRRTMVVTLPMISPVILFNVILALINGFQYFTEPFIMLNGEGVQQSGLFYATYLYQNAFQFFKMGYASAMGWILFVIVIILTVIVFRTSARFIYYSGGKK